MQPGRDENGSGLLGTTSAHDIFSSLDERTLAMATEVGCFNFYAKDLARTVMGKTRPGSHDIVYVQPVRISPDLIHFHENSHRSLHSATTVGKYLSALAIAADRRGDSEGPLGDAVRRIATLCLYAHEGYATAMQERSWLVRLRSRADLP